MNEKDIIKRWNERVVPNNWHNEGRSGACAYLEKYGKNISNDKLQAIADYARKLGFIEFADYMLRAQVAKKVATVTPIFREVSIEEAERENFHGDIIDFARDITGSRIVVATIKELADMGIGSCCGSVGNKCFVKLAEKFPEVQVRGALQGTEMSSVEMLIKNDKMGNQIMIIASNKGDGSYRYDGDEADNSWEYFETE